MLRIAGIVSVVISCAAGPLAADDTKPYNSPIDVMFSPDGKTLAATDRTAGTVALIDVAGKKVRATVALEGEPAGVVWAADGSRVYVAEHNAGSVADIDPAAGKVVRRLEVGLRPIGLALAPKAGLLLAANTATATVSVVDLKSGKEKGRVDVLREPFSIAVTPDESVAVVSNLLPEGRATGLDHATAISLIDIKSMKRVGDIRLPTGSSATREVAVSGDGKWAYVVHTVGRTNLPTTQLERGWVNTNGISVIDIKAKKLVATLLLDHPMQGVADPWGLVRSADGKKMWVSIAGTHQVAHLDLVGLHKLLDESDEAKRSELVNDLAALYRGGLMKRTKIAGNGLRGIDLSPDGKVLAAAVYFSGNVELLDAETGKTQATVALGPARDPCLVRKGEMIFHDGHYCFQHWLSCATCHPNDARVDGLNWDLLNDGLGNPKNNRSLLWSHKTPPAMTRGVRETMEDASKAGFLHILFRQPEEETLTAVAAYLRSLEPLPSPYLPSKGGLTAAQKRGLEVFNTTETGCVTCHPAPLYADLKMHDVGTRGPLDKASTYDTPSLIELYRTGPFLHDGSAATVREVLVDRNKQDRHGKTSHLTPQQLDDLAAFLLAL